MLRFINKEGKQQMVVKDNGETVYFDKELKEAVENADKKQLKEKKAEDKEDE